MLAAIVRFSLRFRGVVIALACLFIGYALFTLTRAKYDVFPEFAPPQVVVQTEAPGLSPGQVEVLVTQPIENSINGVEGVESVRSSSIQGLSIITATFDPRSDIYRDRQLVCRTCRRIVEMVWEDLKPSDLLTRGRSQNAIVNSAIGALVRTGDRICIGAPPTSSFPTRSSRAGARSLPRPADRGIRRARRRGRRFSADSSTSSRTAWC